MNPQDTHHNLVLHLKLQGPVDRDVLSQRLNALVERHSVLRTVYHDSVDGPQQQVLPASNVRLTLHDQLADCLAQEHATPVDLKQGPLLRAHLISHDHQHDLLLTLHHIAFDGRSAQLLLAELAAQAANETPVQYLTLPVGKPRTGQTSASPRTRISGANTWPMCRKPWTWAAAALPTANTA